jgi:hypothetical protein
MLPAAELLVKDDIGMYISSWCIRASQQELTHQLPTDVTYSSLFPMYFDPFRQWPVWNKLFDVCS